jgi:hypothetical protein
MEALNVSGIDVIPMSERPGGVNNTLTVRVPVEMGTYSAGTTYAVEVVVEYPASSGIYYKSRAAANVGNTPNTSPTWWTVHEPNIVYVQFPELLTQASVTPAWAAWTVQPTFTSSVYGFLELRVTEPTIVGLFPRTWKPMRGIVEFLYSPTKLV